MAGIFGGASINEVNELISQYGVWELEDTFTSFDRQDAVEDVVTPIDFGASKTTPDGLVQYDDSVGVKEFTVLKSGPYFVKTRQRAARIGGNAGESELFVQSQFSVDNSVSWLPNGNSVDLKLDDSKQVEIFFDMSPVFAPAGLKLRQVFARSSEGTDFGSFLPGTPSAALTAAGITDSPAAQISLYKLRGYNYV